QAAQTLALRHNNQFLQPEHLLRCLLDDDSNVVKTLIRSSGGRVEDVEGGTDELLAKLPEVETENPQLHLAPLTAKALDAAEQAPKKSGDAYVTLERILQGITLVPSAEAAKLLQKCGVNAEKLNQAINTMRKGRTADNASSEDQFEALKK